MRFKNILFITLHFFVFKLPFQCLRTFLMQNGLWIHRNIFNRSLFFYGISCLYNFILIDFFINPFPCLRYSNIYRWKSPLNSHKNYMIEHSLKVSIFLDQPLNQSIHRFIGSIVRNPISHLSKKFVFTLLDLLACLAKFLIMSNA